MTWLDRTFLESSVGRPLFICDTLLQVPSFSEMDVMSIKVLSMLPSVEAVMLHDVPQSMEEVKIPEAICPQAVDLIMKHGAGKYGGESRDMVVTKLQKDIPSWRDFNAVFFSKDVPEEGWASYFEAFEAVSPKVWSALMPDAAFGCAMLTRLQSMIQRKEPEYLRDRRENINARQKSYPPFRVIPTLMRQLCDAVLPRAIKLAQTDADHVPVLAEFSQKYHALEDMLRCAWGVVVETLNENDNWNDSHDIRTIDSFET